jgi:hypothetical protein
MFYYAYLPSVLGARVRKRSESIPQGGIGKFPERLQPQLAGMAQSSVNKRALFSRGNKKQMPIQLWMRMQWRIQTPFS